MACMPGTRSLGRGICRQCAPSNSTRPVPVANQVSRIRLAASVDGDRTDPGGLQQPQSIARAAEQSHIVEKLAIRDHGYPEIARQPPDSLRYQPHRAVSSAGELRPLIVRALLGSHSRQYQLLAGPFAICEMEKFSAAVHHPNLAVTGNRGCALTRDHLAVGIPVLAVPVQNALSRRRPNLLAIQSEIALDGTALRVRHFDGSPSGSIPIAQPRPAPREYPDRPFSGHAKLFGKTGGRGQLLPAVFGLVKDRTGGSCPIAHPY